MSVVENPATVQAPSARDAHGGRRWRSRALLEWRGLPMVAVALLTLGGLTMRLVVAHQSLWADELSTYWIITTHGLRGVISTVHGNAEITPPLYFVLSWLSTRVGHAPELVRAPSLIAGVVTIPLVYLLGRRTVGKPAALLATALTTLSPFMIYYSAEARAYGLMMGLVTASTLAMLIAVETRRARWWFVYAACSAAAAYSHYTCAFVLGAQLLWLLWAHPEARRPAILANIGAVVAFAPWTTGLINDINSPTSKILSALSPFTPHAVATDLGHWAIGYPYGPVPLRDLPGEAALALLALACAMAVAGIARRAVGRRSRRWSGRLDRRLVLVIVLALSVPVGEAIVSALSTHLFGVRNLAASWPALALLFAALLMAAGPRLRLAAAALAIAGFALGGVAMLQNGHQRPEYQAAANFVVRHATPRDVVVDETVVLSPGPLSSLDITLKPGHKVFRARAPAERDHPFGFSDPTVPPSVAIPQAVAAAHGGRVFVVQNVFSAAGLRALQPTKREPDRFPARYRLVEIKRLVGVRVYVYADRASG